MSNKTGVSRRNFMRAAAVAAAVPAAAATSVNAADTADILVAATVVRASLSRTERGALRLGVRVSVMAEDFTRENIVVTVEGVRFGASADETRRLISKAVQERIVGELESAGVAVDSNRIAVQVFGGVMS